MAATTKDSRPAASRHKIVRRYVAIDKDCDDRSQADQNGRIETYLKSLVGKRGQRFILTKKSATPPIGNSATLPRLV